MDLSALTKPGIKPPIITIVGTPGVGKTSLAALFPNAVMIQAEEASGVFDSWPEELKPALFPALPRTSKKNNEILCSPMNAILEQLRALASEDHDYKTLIIDSVTSLSNLFEHEISEIYGVDNVADAAGGFHKGYLVLKEMHMKVRFACDHLRNKKGMTIIFLAHITTNKIKNRPDADEYTVYSLDINEKSIPSYVNLVDAVLYMKQEEFVKGRMEDKKGNVTKFGKIVQTGERVLICAGDGKIGYVNAKNRMDLDNEIPVPKGENPLLELIPYFKNMNINAKGNQQ